MLTRPQIAAFEKALAVCNQVMPRLELLTSLARHSPALEQRVTELRTKRDYLYAMAESALEFERQWTAQGR